MKILFIFITLLSSAINNNNVIISQGSVAVTFDDLDGYALKIPKDKRFGFFSSTDRLDKTITKILQMKQVVFYAKTQKLINENDVNTKVTSALMNYTSDEISGVDPVNQNNYNLFKKFILLQESYKAALDAIKARVNTKNLEMLAKEEYKINKSKYYLSEIREFDYININYDKDNKEIQKKIANILLNKLKNSSNTIKDIAKEYQNSEVIKFVLDVNDYTFDEKYKEFSEFVFKPNHTGVINQLLDANNRFIVVYLNKIIESHLQPFEEVKGPILSKLEKDKINREFNKLLSNLTKDKVNLNQENLVSIRKRYKKN